MLARASLTGVLLSIVMTMGAAAQERSLQRATPVPADPRPGQLESTETPEKDTVYCDDVDITVTLYGLGVKCRQENGSVTDEKLQQTYAIGKSEEAMITSASTMLSSFKLLERGSVGDIVITYRGAVTSEEEKTCQITAQGNGCKRILSVKWYR